MYVATKFENFFNLGEREKRAQFVELVIMFVQCVGCNVNHINIV